MQPKIELTNLIDVFYKTIKSSSNEIKSLLKNGHNSYIQNQIEKYYFTNNLIHREVKVVFDKIYYPISVKHGLLYTQFSNLKDVFSEYNSIVVSGMAGSGKSSLIKHIFLNSIKQSFQIPILIKLRNLNNYEGSLLNYLLERLTDVKIEPSIRILERALDKGEFLFLLDGYDEVFSENTQKIYKEIQELCDKYPKNNYLITTRPGSGIELIDRFYKFTILPINEKEINTFIDTLLINEVRKNNVKSIISNSDKYSYNEYLRNPLLLSMFILAIERHPEIPNKKTSFYRNVFDTLYTKIDSDLKGGNFSHKKKSKLFIEDFMVILEKFSFISILKGKYSFLHEYLFDLLLKIKKTGIILDYNVEYVIFDLVTNISILLKDGFEYTFPHRSMQEYFGASYIAHLPQINKIQVFELLRKSINNHNVNHEFLLRLYKELDYYHYYKYLVLKEFENNLLNNINSNSKTEIISSVCQILGFELTNLQSEYCFYDFDNKLLRTLLIIEGFFKNNYTIRNTQFSDKIENDIRNNQIINNRIKDKNINTIGGALLSYEFDDEVINTELFKYNSYLFKFIENLPEKLEEIKNRLSIIEKDIAVYETNIDVLI